MTSIVQPGLRSGELIHVPVGTQRRNVDSTQIRGIELFQLCVPAGYYIHCGISSEHIQKHDSNVMKLHTMHNLGKRVL